MSAAFWDKTCELRPSMALFLTYKRKGSQTCYAKRKTNRHVEPRCRYQRLTSSNSHFVARVSAPIQSCGDIAGLMFKRVIISRVLGAQTTFEFGREIQKDLGLTGGTAPSRNLENHAHRSARARLGCRRWIPPAPSHLRVA